LQVGDRLRGLVPIVTTVTLERCVDELVDSAVKYSSVQVDFVLARLDINVDGLASAVGLHHVEVVTAVPIAGKGDAGSVGGPGRVEVDGRVVGEVGHPRSRRRS
jgi:hypothetical protein